MTETNAVPRVTVITPVYNCESYLAETAASVRVQAGVTFEHILVDDGSTDGSGRILDEQVPLLSPGQVSVIHRENGGEASAVNEAWEVARGEYVVVVNADDPLRPDALALLCQALDDNPNAVVAYPDWLMIDGNGATLKIKRTHEYSQQALIADFVCLPGPGAMIRRSALGTDPPRDRTFRFVSDYELWLRLSLVGGMVRVPEVLATWRKHAEGATAKGRGTAITAEMMRVIDEFMSNDERPPHIKAWRRQAFAMSRYYAGIQKLYDPEVPGRRLMFRSFATLFRRRARYDTERREFLGLVAVLAVPISTSLGRALRRKW